MTCCWRWSKLKFLFKVLCRKHQERQCNFRPFAYCPFIWSKNGSALLVSILSSPNNFFWLKKPTRKFIVLNIVVTWGGIVEKIICAKLLVTIYVLASSSKLCNLFLWGLIFLHYNGGKCPLLNTRYSFYIQQNLISLSFLKF